MSKSENETRKNGSNNHLNSLGSMWVQKDPGGLIMKNNFSQLFFHHFPFLAPNIGCKTNQWWLVASCLTIFWEVIVKLSGSFGSVSGCFGEVSERCWGSCWEVFSKLWVQQKLGKRQEVLLFQWFLVRQWDLECGVQIVQEFIGSEVLESQKGPAG